MTADILATDEAAARAQYELEAREAAFHLQYALRVASKPIDGYTLHADDAADIALALDHAARLIAKARLTRTATGPMH